MEVRILKHATHAAGAFWILPSQIALLALVPALITLSLILWLCEGHFTYTLDDPYIHLALARNIFMGHYGINPGEVAAPSSSILWPFLLAPLAALPGLFEIGPLIINLICLSASIALLVRLVAGSPPLFLVVGVLAMAVGLNLFGLVFNGMEHSLQILLVLLILDGLVRHGSGSSRPLYLYVALGLLPLVRYEGLAITVPVLGYLFLKSERVPAFVTGSVTLVAIGGFSAFLYLNGLGLLPTSVLAKTSDTGQWHILSSVEHNVIDNPGLIVWGSILLFLLGRREPLWSSAVGLTLMLHLALGKTGWFGRYEVYVVCFVMVLLVRAVNARWGWRWGLLVMILTPLSFPHLAGVIVRTPPAAQNIYAQQAQMAKIAHILGQPVAVNDLGLMSLRSGQYVLDLWGLGSIEALRLRQAHKTDSSWMAGLMTEKRTHFAFIYDKWLPNHPSSWLRVGTLSLVKRNLPWAETQVALYASDPTASAELRSALDSYVQCCSIPLTRITYTDAPY